MAKYVLVHGSWHGGWCWEKVVPLLEQAGHEVDAPDLPGHGNNYAPISDISLQSYVDCVCQALDRSTDPVYLVGHSMAGAVITQTAEYRPDKIKALIYLAAFLPGKGESVRQISESSGQTLINQNRIVAEDRSYSIIREEALKDLFYGLCTDEDVHRAKSRLVKQASAPTSTPLNTTPEKFGSVPRYYIECLQDGAIPVALQRKMHMALPCRKVFTLDTDHSPFYSDPVQLVKYLTSI